MSTARRLHRWLSVVAAIPIAYVASTGCLIAFDGVWASTYMRLHGMGMSPQGVPSPALAKMLASDGALADSDLTPMLIAVTGTLGTITANHPVRVIRFRMYGEMPQVAIVTGDVTAEQVVISGRTGMPVGLYERGYPKSPLPFQQGAHELWKRMHRGDIFGLTGRWIDLLSGVALLFLTISGSVMYLDLLRSRRRRHLSGMFWPR